MSNAIAPTEMSQGPDQGQDQSRDRRALLHNALNAIESLEAKLAAVEEARNEPIAVVGMSCRLPGGVDSPDSFWQLLVEKRDAITHFPAERQRIAEAFGYPENAENVSSWQGGFVDGIEQFDPQFFGISPREAVTMDPQQRLVLEVAWEALERAGQAPDQLAGSLTGVYLGISTNDYGQVVRLNGYEEMDPYSATGGSMNVAAGRLAFTLGFQGPCMAIDTACSSSLVAVHLAMQDLRAGHCSMALAGGVNIVLMADGFVAFEKWGMTAPNGRSKAFDASADGFVRAEGCGMIVLKRLSDARANGDTILALLRGSAINQDGRSSGLTVPNGLAQQDMLRRALNNAAIAPADVQYIEAHGTGTPIGDPIEVEAIGAVLGEGRPNDKPLFLSSVKTNIGHLESASGIAGMIKVILSMQHGEIAPLLHLKQRSPQIPWPAFPIEIPTEPTPWPAVDGRRIAGISGFGFSGTNAHIVLESPPGPAAAQADPAPGILTTETKYHLLPLSGRNRAGLAALVARYAQHLAEHPELDLADICHTTALGRGHYTQRAAFVAANTQQMAQRLAAFAQEEESAQPAATGAPRVAFLFTGQGSQYTGMGAALYAHAPVFRDALDRCAAILAGHLDRPLLDIIFGAQQSADDGAINQTAYTQPALFALEFALSELWRSWGIAPVAVLGHSVGEYVAAVTAGVMSLEDGLRLIAERGRLMQALPAGGAMAAIFAPLAQVQAALSAHSATLSVAAVNGPAHTVISGTEAAVSQVADAFAADGVRVQRLTVSHAFHSPLMDPILDPFARAAGAITMRAPRIPLISNATGKVAGQEITNASYWRQHVRGAVEFNASMETLHQLGVDVLLEIGPQPVLLGMARAMPFMRAGSGAGADKAPDALPSLRKGHDEWEQMLTSLGALYVQGAAVRWPALAANTIWRKLSLPTYPFQRRRYWVELPARRKAGAAQVEGHPLLGRRVRSPLLRESIYETTISAERPAYLADHRVQHQVIFPGSAYVEMALAAAAGFAADGVATDLSLRAMLALTDAQPRTVQLLLTPDGDAHATLKIVSSPAIQAAAGWADEIEDFTLHAEGALKRAAHAQDPALDLAAVQARLAPGAMDTHAYYAEMDEQGLDYGPAFRCLAQLYAGEGEALGAVALPAANTDEAKEYQIHPALLDGCFHVIGAALRAPASSSGRLFYVPLEMEGVRVYKPGAKTVWCYVTIVPGHDGAVQAGAEIISAQLHIVDEAGSPVASVDRLHLRLMKSEGMSRRASARQAKWLYEVAWQTQQLAPAAPVEGAQQAGRWLVFADEGGVGEALAARLTAAGAACTLVLADAEQAQANGNHTRVSPLNSAAIQQLVDAQAAGGPLQGVIYLWGMNGSANNAEDAAARLQQIDAGVFHLVQALGTAHGRAPRLYLGTRGAQSVGGETADPVAATLWGFGRSVGNEVPALRCTLIDIEPERGPDSVAGVVDALANELLADSSETQVLLRSGVRYVARLAHHHTPTAHVEEPMQLVLAARGALEAISYAPLARVAPRANQVEVAVRATGLNFRDVLNVLGMYPGDPGMPGLECAGVVTAVGADVTHVQVGDPVLALAARAFDSYVLADGALTVRLPDTLTYAEAVTLPSAYLTAAYGLHDLARLQAGERVLIHAAAGGVGIAAVALAQRAGAEIFATAGSEEKHAFLRSLGVRHIYSSRTLDFADQIMADTNGAGMDVILNSLADAFLARSMDILAPRGRFLEIGKRGIWTDEQFAAAHPEGAYFPYDLTAILQSEPDVIYAMLEGLMREAAQGSIKPLPLRAFPTENIVDAFRFMAQARHIGKVVVTHNPAHTGERVHANASYLITGGLGGLGLAVAQWLAARGASHLTLVGRSAPSAAADTVLATLRAAGVDVQVVAADIGVRSDVVRVLDAIAAERPPLRGIVHAAGILEDGIIQQQEWDRYARVFGPKLSGALHLHELTRTQPLNFFVLFSSASAILGAAGQSNYAAANAALDMLAHMRRAAGLPALSINWGAWSDVGMAAALGAHDQQRVAAQGIAMIQPQQGVDVLEQLLADAAPQVVVLPIHWPTLRAQLLDGGAPAPFFANLLEESGSAAASAPRADTLESVRRAATPEARMAALIAYITDRVMRVLALDSTHAPTMDQRLVEIGMDSLMAVELRNRLESDLHVSLSLASLFEGATIRTLADEIDAQLAAAAPPSTAEPQNSTPVGAEGAAQAPEDLLSHLSEMSDADVDALLSEMLNQKGAVDGS